MATKTATKNISTSDVVARAQAVLAQTKAQGSKPFAGSSYEKSLKKASTVISPVSLLKNDIPKNTDKALKLSTGLQTAQQKLYAIPGETKEQYQTRVGGGKTENTNTGALSAGELATLGMNPSDFDLDKKTGLYSPKATTGMTPEEKRFQDATDNAEKEYEKETGQWKSMMKGYDQLADSQIGSISAIYDQRRAEQADINKREQAALNTTNIMAGTQRYAPMTATSLMSASERAGMAQIQKLDAEEQSLIMQAQEAAQTGKFKALDQIMTLYDKKRTTKLALLEKQAEMAREERDKLTERKNKLDAEEGITSLIQSGDTDPLSVYTKAREQGLEVTLGEIINTIADITPKAPEIGAEARDYEYAKTQGYTGGYLQYIRDKGNAGRAPAKTTTSIGTTGAETGFNYGSGKITDVKAQVRKTFPLDFGTKIITQLTDEELREFMLDYEDTVKTEARNIDPYTFLPEWLTATGKVETDGKIGAPKKAAGSLVDQLNAAFPD